MKATPSSLARWLRFNAVGAIGIGVQLAVLALLHKGLGMSNLLATTLAVEAAVLHNFLWHERFTWPDRKANGRTYRLLKFNLSTGVFSIAGNLVFTKFLLELEINYLLAATASIALCSIINFSINDRFVFAIAPTRS
jgi:putative flippase GtrA